MREHEVPTHVQTEDKVLLWFSFPQIVALIAVSAFSYGAYHYLPGPSGLRIALAVLIGALGVAMVVVKIGGRRLPMVAADLMKYRLGARLYVGSPAQLTRSEPPAPVETGPGPLGMMAKRGRRGARRLRVMARRGLRRMRKNRSRRNGRQPFRPHGWFGKRRKPASVNGENGSGRPSAGRNENKRTATGSGEGCSVSSWAQSRWRCLPSAFPRPPSRTATTPTIFRSTRRSSLRYQTLCRGDEYSSSGSSCRETALRSPFAPPPASTYE